MYNIFAVDLTGTQINDNGLAALQMMGGFEWLSLNRTQITDKGLKILEDVVGLNVLSLNQTKITDAGLSELKEMAGLDGLSLDQTQITDVGLSALHSMTGLRVLSLNQTPITDAGLVALQGIPNLQRLYLKQTQITSLAALTDVMGLQDLDISGTKVQDLRPICDLPFNTDVPDFGLHYAGTAAVSLDPKLAELVAIAKDDARTKETLAYLKSLPKYPAPLPWLQQDYLKSQEVPAPAPQARQEPPMTRGQVKVKTSAVHLKFILARPDYSQVMAKEVAAQIRAHLRDITRENNALPDSFLAIEGLADALDSIGAARIGPKEKDRVDDLKLHIGQLEAQVARLTQSLKDAEVLQETDKALTRAYAAKMDAGQKVLDRALNVGEFAAKVGLVGGAVYFLGPANPVIVALLGVLAAMK